MPEFTEWIGTEHLLIKRAVDQKVAEKISSTLNTFLDNTMRLGIDFRGIQPLPGNIEGGLSTIEEKSLGTISKAGTAPINGVIEYSESPKGRGLWLMIEPGLDVESMTGLAAAGAQIIAMTTGRGSPCGNPVAPVSNIDIDASKIITNNKTVQNIADDLWLKLKQTCNGEKTYAEKLGFEDIAIWRCTAAPFQIFHSR